MGRKKPAAPSTAATDSVTAAAALDAGTPVQAAAAAPPVVAAVPPAPQWGWDWRAGSLVECRTAEGGTVLGYVDSLEPHGQFVFQPLARVEHGTTSRIGDPATHRLARCCEFVLVRR